MAAAGYQLKSELARLCLPAPDRAANRLLARVNSLCLFFLLVGVVGQQSRMPGSKPVPPLEQPAPIIVEPLPPVAAPAAATPQTEQQSDDDKPQAPSIQAVTLDTPAINFAVPTVGSLVVPLSVAPAPLEMPIKRAAPVKHEPTTIQSTGQGGDRPAPTEYPRIALQLGQQGTVVLLLTVDDAGKMVSVEIRESSGSIILDESARDWIKRHWTVPPVNGGHTFIARIKYQLRQTSN